MEIRVEENAVEYKCMDEANKCLKNFYQNHNDVVFLDANIEEIATVESDLMVVLTTRFIVSINSYYYQAYASWCDLGGRINRNSIKFNGRPDFSMNIEYIEGKWFLTNN